MAARTKARKRALDVLFEAEQRGLDPLAVLARRITEPGTQAPLPQYAAELVEGVVANLERIDEVLATHSHGWSVPRMPAVDRNLLRLGAWEILYNDEVPDMVAVAQAVGLAEELSTDESPAFVNGLLARIVELKPTLLA